MSTLFHGGVALMPFYIKYSLPAFLVLRSSSRQSELEVWNKMYSQSEQYIMMRTLIALAHSLRSVMEILALFKRQYRSVIPIPSYLHNCTFQASPFDLVSCNTPVISPFLVLLASFVDNRRICKISVHFRQHHLVIGQATGPIVLPWYMLAVNTRNRVQSAV